MLLNINYIIVLIKRLYIITCYIITRYEINIKFKATINNN